MFARAVVFLLILQATLVLGEPVPVAAPTAAPVPKRANIISDATSAFGDFTSGVVSDADVVYSFVTSEYHAHQNM
jgi:hypothetical protein